MRRLALAVLVVVAAAACGPHRPAPVTAFEGRLTDWTRAILSDSPELATQAGVSAEAAGGPYNDRLDDRTAMAVEARRSAALRRDAQLHALSRDGLDAADALTYDVLDAQFAVAAQAAEFDYGDFTPLGGIKPYVLNQLDSAFLTLPSFLDERHAVADADDAEAYLRRLRAVADAIDAETERARADAERGVRPPIFIMDATLGLLNDIASAPPIQQVYVTSFRRKLDALAEAAPEGDARAAIERRNLAFVARAEAIVRDHVLPAHQRAAAFLRADRANATEMAGVSHLPRGAEFYAASLRFETTTDLTPAQIHRIGRERVEALTDELDIALRRVGLTQGPVGERLRALTADPRYRYADTDEGRAELMHDIEARVARVLERAPQWFGRMPRAPLEVRRVPTFAEGAQSGAYYNPPSLDGEQPGIYYVNLRDLSELTRIDLPTQDFHEAVPGHHFQIALAQEQTDAPLLQRLISFNAYSEGWGLYAEELADELGFHEGDPVGRIGFLRWQLWRAARLVVDTGLHAQNWSRQQAIDYLRQTHRRHGWRHRLRSRPLHRLAGAGLRLRTRPARDHAAARGGPQSAGPDFDLRGFHDAVLLSGETPLGVLDTIVTDWIPEQRRLAERERRRR
ncbi:MAG: DUF885 family protein [Hyphomonadaceae bacterium]